MEEHVDAAFEDFKVNLDRFREVVTVRTVAMHGSPPRAADGMVLPSRIMINVHLQRWTGSFVPWVRV